MPELLRFVGVRKPRRVGSLRRTDLDPAERRTRFHAALAEARQGEKPRGAMVAAAERFVGSREYLSRPSDEWPEMFALAAAVDGMDEPTVKDVKSAVKEAFGRSADAVVLEEEFGQLARRARDSWLALAVLRGTDRGLGARERLSTARVLAGMLRAVEVVSLLTEEPHGERAEPFRPRALALPSDVFPLPRAGADTRSKGRRTPPRVETSPSAAALRQAFEELVTKFQRHLASVRRTSQRVGVTTTSPVGGNGRPVDPDSGPTEVSTPVLTASLIDALSAQTRDALTKLGIGRDQPLDDALLVLDEAIGSGVVERMDRGRVSGRAVSYSGLLLELTPGRGDVP